MGTDGGQCLSRPPCLGVQTPAPRCPRPPRPLLPVTESSPPSPYAACHGSSVPPTRVGPPQPPSRLSFLRALSAPRLAGMPAGPQRRPRWPGAGQRDKAGRDVAAGAPTRTAARAPDAGACSPQRIRGTPPPGQPPLLRGESAQPHSPCPPAPAPASPPELGPPAEPCGGEIRGDFKARGYAEFVPGAETLQWGGWERTRGLRSDISKYFRASKVFGDKL